MNVVLKQGDCRKLLKSLPDNSVDSIVTDPPYELAFMGKKWDGSGIAYDVKMWEECLRVLKPGGHMLAFGGTRTHHRMTCAIEDAGFEIRDELDWLYASGFPKSLNVSKLIDRQAGHTRASASVPNMKNKVYGKGMGGGEWNAPSEPPVTDAAKQWEGWGTALKPAREPIILARKPMDVSIGENVQKHGTGALNIDACRIGSEERTYKGSGANLTKLANHAKGDTGIGSWDGHSKDETFTAKGRWPANLLLSHSPDCVCVGAHTVPGYAINRWDDGAKPFGDGAGHPFTSEQQPDEVVEEWQCVPECPVRQLDEQSGDRPGFVSNGNATVGEASNGITPFRRGTGGIWHHGNGIPCGPQYSDNGGASRFFYVAKPSRAEREAGCEQLPVKSAGEATGGRSEGSDGLNSPRAGAGRTSDGVHNFHPTVKPILLMRYLCLLITPPGGIVLDPFMGSGTTGCGAVQEGFKFIGFDLEAEHVAIAKARIDYWTTHKHESDSPIAKALDTRNDPVLF